MTSKIKSLESLKKASFRLLVLQTEYARLTGNEDVSPENLNSLIDVARLSEGILPSGKGNAAEYRKLEKHISFINNEWKHLIESRKKIQLITSSGN